MKAWGYDAASRTLAIRHTPGKVQHWLEIPQEVADKFAAHPSKGQALHQLLRNGGFTSVPVLDTPEENEDAPITTTAGESIDTAKPWKLPAETAAS
jgi:hypothetical protein